MERSFRDLVVWQQGMKLVDTIYRSTQHFPRSEDYALTSQMRRSAASVPSNIAEGSARTPKDYLNFLRITRGSLRELSTQVEIARRVGYLDAETESAIQTECESVGKLLTRFIVAVRKQAEEAL